MLTPGARREADFRPPLPAPSTINLLTSSAVSLGSKLNSRPATPDTRGAAADVPEKPRKLFR